ncbi:MAG: hypothetical protein JST00_26895 [Deltaproteobacteria bacterium]|nr:hypothetical protein [Deltaproteobacteria bacterium]
MALARKLLFVTLAAGALYGVQACTSETELNPQPLPPENPGAGAIGDPTGKESDRNGSSGSLGSSSSSGGSSTPPPGDGDGGADGDADSGGG